MSLIPSKLLYDITVPKPKNPARKATVDSILIRARSSTEQALKGYDFLKSHNPRKASQN
jgi:hypothetical protein